MRDQFHQQIIRLCHVSVALLFSVVAAADDVLPELGESSGSEFNTTISTGEQPGDVTKLLANIPVSVAQTNVQQTSIDVSDGYIYSVNIEPGPNGDVAGFDLRTILWQGRQYKDGSWDWQSIVVSDRTSFNRWHTAPSVAVDKNGFIHVVYNMHNFPWQYKRSKTPHDITNLEFFGQELGDDEIRRALEQNRTSFPTLGKASLPGNQITYPAFYRDGNNDLYITYRFAAAPKRRFSDRFMSSGIALYDANSKIWTAIGGKVEHEKDDFEIDSNADNQAVAYAGKRGWTSYLPRLAFDSENSLIFSALWREGTAGALVSRPCVIRSGNSVSANDLAGKSIKLPLGPDDCSNIGIDNTVEFYSIGAFALSNDDVPYFLLSPVDDSRFISRYVKSEDQWVVEKSPHGATEIFFDADNNMYAIASGIKIFKRASDENEWQIIYEEKDVKNCYPKVKMDEKKRTAFIHTQSCDEKSVTIYGLRLN